VAAGLASATATSGAAAVLAAGFLAAASELKKMLYP